MCNKMAFNTEALAMGYAHQVKADARHRKKYKGNDDTLRNLRSYECPECGKWHLTSTGNLKGKQLKTKHKQLEKTNNQEEI